MGINHYQEQFQGNVVNVVYCNLQMVETPEYPFDIGKYKHKTIRITITNENTITNMQDIIVEKVNFTMQVMTEVPPNPLQHDKYVTGKSENP